MRSIFKIFSFCFLLVILLAGCNQASKNNMEDAKEEYKEGNENMKEAASDVNNEAKTEVREDWNTFKSESEITIANLETEAKTLETRISSASKNEREKLKIRLDKKNAQIRDFKEDLRVRNEEFESDMERFDDKVSAKYASFKREFKHDTEEFGKSMKNFFNDNEE